MKKKNCEHKEFKYIQCGGSDLNPLPTCKECGAYVFLDGVRDIVSYRQGFQAGKDSMKEEILSKLPDKQDERKRDNIEGSWLDNPRIQRAIGFNSCLNQVKNIIKNV